ncbi:MAG: hypothetical protein ABIR36_05010, partial [Nitrospiraceae bacterium]
MMMGRQSIGAKLGIGMVFVAAFLLSHGLEQGLHAQDASKPTLEKAFPSSSKCKRCHERVFEEWETSPLSKSIHSPAFR